MVGFISFVKKNNSLNLDIFDIAASVSRWCGRAIFCQSSGGLNEVFYFLEITRNYG